jgi:hypothetical protein
MIVWKKQKNIIKVKKTFAYANAKSVRKVTDLVDRH